MSLRIRTMRADEIPLALDWAAAEGWNPGLADAACFAAADPDGFLVGEVDGAPAAIISCVRYGETFAFLGFYVVRQDLRGRGYGMALWRAAVAHAGDRLMGLDGVVAQQANYARSGFRYAYANMRYGGQAFELDRPTTDIRPLEHIPFAAIEAADAAVFPAPRAAFLRAWVAAPGHVGRALVRDGRLAAWGVIRPCRTGRKVGPLVADDRAGAEAVLSALTSAEATGGNLFLDVPAINPDAVALADAIGLAPVFETARMYTRDVGPLRLDRLFGVTTFELG